MCDMSFSAAEIQHGHTICWNNGAECAGFLARAAGEYRRACPEIQIGWPGLSPGDYIPNIRTAAMPFWQQAVATGVVDECDWIGAHCYFTNQDEMRGNAGHYFRNYVRGNKPILITEFSNPTLPLAFCINSSNTPSKNQIES